MSSFYKQLFRYEMDHLQHLTMAISAFNVQHVWNDSLCKWKRNTLLLGYNHVLSVCKIKMFLPFVISGWGDKVLVNSENLDFHVFCCSFRSLVCGIYRTSQKCRHQDEFHCQQRDSIIWLMWCLNDTCCFSWLIWTFHTKKKQGNSHNI